MPEFLLSHTTKWIIPCDFCIKKDSTILDILILSVVFLLGCFFGFVVSFLFRKKFKEESESYLGSVLSNNKEQHKLLLDWREYVREVNIEDAIHPDNESVIVSTMHKAKGKEFDDVWIHLENYDFNGDESKRLFYVALSRANIR